MKFFSEKKKDEDFIIDTEKNENITIQSGSKIAPSHKLTVDEVLGNNKPSTQRYDGKSALESLKQRMLQTSENSAPEKEQELTKELYPFLLQVRMDAESHNYHL